MIKRSFNNELLSKDDKKQNELISLVYKLSPKEVHSANHIITIMQYTKGAQKGQILSPYLQNKALQFTYESLSIQIIQVGQVSMHSAAECTKLVYEFLIGEPSNTWLSHNTLSLWYKDIFKLSTDTYLNKIQNVTGYRIIVDKSKRGKIKNFILSFMFWSFTYNEPLVTMIHLRDIDKCDRKSVSETVQILIKNS
ncbi:3462_t:CDS:2 [Gigaspora margarita]|uniref:3462_t:CDS:1 n=1 Tax=Gigaspora margarita TaxID=4874 RepID=A0ABN7UTT9_GIGMA|nr:3462_t:CDS:2 [Gigaspora margarita]